MLLCSSPLCTNCIVRLSWRAWSCSSRPRPPTPPSAPCSWKSPCPCSLVNSISTFGTSGLSLRQFPAKYGENIARIVQPYKIRSRHKIAIQERLWYFCHFMHLYDSDFLARGEEYSCYPSQGCYRNKIQLWNITSLNWKLEAAKAAWLWLVCLSLLSLTGSFLVHLGPSQ